MDSIIITVISVALVVALCVSIARFLSDSRAGAESVRRLAALSCAVTLVVTIIIYSGQFRRQTLAALHQLRASHDLYLSVHDVVTWLDHAATRVANFINDLLGAAQVGFRPNPPIWPALLLIAGYGLRFLIYRLHKKNENLEAAMTGAVYLSHVTTYVMVVAFLIVISGQDPWLLIPLSLVVLGVIIVSIKLVLEDLGAAARALLQTLWTEITRVARRIAYLATAFAAWVRTVLAYANEIYIKNIRNPLRARIASVEARNETAKRRSKKRLEDQETDYRERFKDSARTRRRKP